MGANDRVAPTVGDCGDAEMGANDRVAPTGGDCGWRDGMGANNRVGGTIAPTTQPLPFGWNVGM